MTDTVYFNGRFLSQKRTGVQRYAHEVLLALDGLLARAPRSRNFELLVPEGAPLPELRAIRARHVGPLAGHAWEQLTLPWAARDGLLWSFGPTGPLYRRSQGVTIHDATVRAIPHAFSWKFRAFYALALPLLTSRAAQVMTVSEFSRGELRRYFGVEPQTLEVSGEGWQHAARIEPDPSILTQHGLTPGRYVLAVSSVTPHKNFAVITRAIEQLGGDQRVVIAGDINEKVFGAVTLRGVTLAGHVSDGALRSLYENAGVFVFPSLYEGFGLPPLEAMSYGCPVIASSAASMPEVCGDGAWYFEPDDARQLALLIQRLMSDRDERRALVAKGHERLAAHSWEAAAAVHLTAIERALQRLTGSARS